MFVATRLTSPMMMHGLGKSLMVNHAAIATTGTCINRSVMTAARSAQRLVASQTALFRLGAAAAAGGVVVVGGGGGIAMMYGVSPPSCLTITKSPFATWFVPFSWDLSSSISTMLEGTPLHLRAPALLEESEEDDRSADGGAVLATAASSDTATAAQDSLWDRIFGGSSSNGDDGSNNNSNNERAPGPSTKDVDVAEDTCHSGPGKRVKVQLDDDVIDSLPVMSLAQVRKATSTNHLLVTYEGIVYDVTQFVHDHPGGAELLKTAAGLDLDHFFGNYIVHGRTEKAAQWLAPLAVGKLSTDDAIASRDSTTPEVHVARRAQMLSQRRRRILIVALTLPLWMTVRCAIGWIGWFVPPLGRLLAWAVPVTVPGLTKGSEPLDTKKQPYKVAVIGGGIAGCGAAWTLAQSGFDVTLYEAREKVSGNARTFHWDFSPFRGLGATVESCVSVTAWPPIFYKNYTCLLEKMGVETVHQPLSWFLNSKVPGYEGTLWECDPEVYPGSLREVFRKDFDIYRQVVQFSRSVTNFFTMKWAPHRWNDLPSMYDTHVGIGLLNPLTTVPLYSLFKWRGGSDAWWNIVFTPQYTASFLVDELRPFPAVFGPLIEDQIPLLPDEDNSWKGSSTRGETDCNITTCVTWKDAGEGIRKVFDLLVKDVSLKENSRVSSVTVLPDGKLRVLDEFDSYIDVDRVIFACPSNAIGNIFKKHTSVPFANTILSTPVYADDHHPATGHMHAVMHSDGSVLPEEYREDCLKRASNYVEVTQLKDGSINIENQYNFGIQTPGPGIYDLPLDQKPVMLISHALGGGKTIDPALVRGTANHARAHPLYSGWNVAAQLSLRLIQGRDGIYYCSNWTTPGNCHDMSLLSGIICAHAIGAKYPFENNKEAKKDFSRLRDLMGV